MIEEITKNIRKKIIHIVSKSKSSHIGSALSCVDILTVLYFKILRLKTKPDQRDVCILSKGHAASALYSTLCEKGYFKEEILNTFCTEGSCLTGHPCLGSVSGIEATTGSLGHGLSIAAGIAIAGKLDKKSYRVFTILGDGECNEGSVWEAAMFSSHHKLDNLIVIIDRNKLQGLGKNNEIINTEPLEEKWNAFGWSTKIINGHNIEQITKVLESVPFQKGKPSLIIANTIKGKGVSFMEDRIEWHYKSPDEEQSKRAIMEINN